MPGVIEEAMKVLTFERGQVEDGWKYLGCGSYRYAYLSPDGVVYKKLKHPGEYDDSMNFQEYKNVLYCKGIPLAGWDVPHAEVFEIDGQDVIAMEFIDGEKDFDCDAWLGHIECNCPKPNGICVWDIWQQPMQYWNMQDIGPENVVIKDGIRYLVDVAD